VSQVQAHAWGNELFFAVQFPDGNIPVVDGNLSDWDVIPDSPYLIGSANMADMYYGATERGEIDISDMAIRSFWGWNDNNDRLYAMAEVFDNVHVVDRDAPATWWADDAWEVYVDVLHLEPADTQYEDGTRWLVGFSVPETAGNIGEALPTFEWRDQNDDGIQWGFDYSFEGEEFGESTYFYELWMQPWDFVSPDGDLDSVEWSDLVEDQLIGMSMAFDDDDVGEQGRHHFWSTSDTGCCVADHDMILNALDASIDWGDQMTAVQSDTWGRIKTQFNGQ
jgi:hypothetical protein